MPTKRKVEKVGGASAGGKEVVRVKMVKRGVPSTSSAGGNDIIEEGGAVGYEQLQNERMAADWQALLAIFPEEVWILILVDIKDPDTLESLSNASPAFRNLLLPRRVQFLFPKVWDILGAPYQDDSTIKLRKVCRAWCDAIDACYENHQFRIIMNNVTPPEKTPLDISYETTNFTPMEAFELDNVDYLQRLMAHFEPTHSVNGVAIRNPFLGRAVGLGAFGLEGPHGARALELLRNLFSMYGHYIWFLGIHALSGSQVAFFSSFAPLLHLVPNLRILDVPNGSLFRERPLGWYDLVPIEGDGPIVSPEELSELEAYNNLHPLPRLEHLRIVTARNVSRCLPAAWFQQLVGINEHLSILEMGHLVRPLEDYNISSATVPNLSVLSVRLQSEEDFETLTSGDNHWRLMKLDLRLDAVSSLDWGRIFKRLETKWEETLIILLLSLPRVESAVDQNVLLEQGGNMKLNLARLTHLHLTMPNLSCLDFLLPMKDNLEVLDIEMNTTYQRKLQGALVKRLENEKMIQLLSKPDKPIESNIWTLFPKLSRLQLYYNVTSEWEVRKSKRSTSQTIWTLPRQEWRSWNKETYNHRRNMQSQWKIKC